ncbi:neural wiskott-aldrich syndrome protein [Stylonychia lemnae]|uniref:Neural wiskott-aldrich syndrome protein n=1 Tax=Stylonychia lemnae TaxID=5949 RepID=A0A078ABW5_STYLE|nr:neural wiskott-aldrich syndrome protein [Stylonychia lemnae]|eukprot:CDW79346.1 neural wiskott-aldrich syndrome protein [Stylonychia lemnae]
MAIVRLFYSDAEGRFQSMKLGGALCIVADRKMHSKYLRLYDMNTCDLLFQTEMYLNFNQKYKELSDYFHYFPLEKVNIGIQFANVHDASVFRNLILQYSIKSENVADTVKEQKSKLGNQNYDITRPLLFERKEHAGWDPVTQTFILNEVPKEIKILLKKAGFKKKDLKKKETALAIYEVLLRGIEFDSSKGQLKSGRTSSNLNNKDFLSNRFSNEDSRILMNDRSNSIMNFGITHHLSSQNNILGASGPIDMLDPYKKQQAMLMNNLPNHALNNNRSSHNIRDKSLGQASDQNGGQKEEQKIMRPPPIPPPLMGMIPPPPMNMAPPTGFLAPPLNQKIQPPPQILNTNSSSIQQQNQALSFNEQLVLQSQNLKKVQEKEINAKVKNMSESQQMNLTQNFAAVLEKRREMMRALGNNKNKDSDEESDDDGNASEDSTW